MLEFTRYVAPLTDEARAQCAVVADTRLQMPGKKSVLAPGAERFHAAMQGATECFVASASLGVAILHHDVVVLIIAHSTGVEAALIEHVRNHQRGIDEVLGLRVDTFDQVWRFYWMGFVIQRASGKVDNLDHYDRLDMAAVMNDIDKRTDGGAKRPSLTALKRWYEIELRQVKYGTKVRTNVYVYHMEMHAGTSVVRVKRAQEQGPHDNVQYMKVPSTSRSSTALAQLQHQESVLVDKIAKRTARIEAAAVEYVAIAANVQQLEDKQVALQRELETYGRV